MTYFTRIKNFVKEYWFLFVGALIAYIAIIFPRKHEQNTELKQYKEYSSGQQDAVELEKLKNERINNSIKKAEMKSNEIEVLKQEKIKELSELKQEDSTKKLADKFNLNNMDS